MSAHPLPDAGDPSFVDLGQVLLRVAGSARAVARSRHVLLSVEVEHGPLVVPGSPTEVHDAVLDVVGQAVSTCRPGAVVALDVRVQDGGIVVDVTDTGPGLPPSSADAWARAVVEAHGGRLAIASVEGVGTTVHMWWPFEDAVSPTPHLSVI